MCLGDYMNIQVHVCIGGKKMADDIRTLQHGVHAVSGTPGRVLDMMSKGFLKQKIKEELVTI